MDLFKLAFEDERTTFYSRDPRDIVDLIKHYHNQDIPGYSRDDPRIAKWSKRVPEISEIKTTDEGKIYYHEGILSLENGDEEVFSEKLQVADDFQILMSKESVLYFDLLRTRFPNLKRENLFKLHVSNAIFGGLYFIPKDVVEGIIKYDLTPHYKNSEEVRSRIEEIKQFHPNLR